MENWVAKISSFTQDILSFSLFVWKRGTRRGTRRISIHPNFLQRFSTTSSGGQASTPGPSVLRVPLDSRPRSGNSYIAETVVSTRTEIQTEHAHSGQEISQEDSVSQIQGYSPRNGERRKDVTKQENFIRTISVAQGLWNLKERLL